MHALIRPEMVVVETDDPLGVQGRYELLIDGQECERGA
jgi:hypothetical protein